MDRRGMYSLGAVMLALAVAGCAINLESAAKLTEGLAKDKASFCVAIWVGVGGGALVPAPAVPIGGGLGYLLVGRTNEPGTTVTLTSEECRIEHGQGGPGVLPVRLP